MQRGGGGDGRVKKDEQKIFNYSDDLTGKKRRPSYRTIKL